MESLVGQGSPDQRLILQFVEFIRRRFRKRVRSLITLLVCACAIFITSNCSLAEQENRFRFSWGGPQSHIWSGKISIEGGKFKNLKLLGLEVDEPGSIYLQENAIHIESPSGRQYDAFDVTIVHDSNAKLNIKFQQIDGRSLTNDDLNLDSDVNVNEIVKQPILRSLDKFKSRLHISRAPGDELQINFDRDNLVFDTEEEFTFALQPSGIEIQPDSNWKCAVSLIDHQTKMAASSKVFDLTANAKGVIEELKHIKVKLPATESIYQLQVKLVQQTLTARLAQAFANKLEREIQLVVLSRKPTPYDWKNQTPWRIIQKIESGDSGSASQIEKGLSKLRIFPGLKRDKNKPPQPPKFTQLQPKQWQAIPLQTRNIGKPHILEVEIPYGAPQTLGVSILQPRDETRISAINVESGVSLPTDQSFTKSDTKPYLHRIVFWPRQRNATLVISNTSRSATAKFGAIRVSAGPESLPPVFADSSDVTSPLPDSRIVACHISKPFLSESFGVGKSYESWADRELHDWSTFYLGAIRLTQYMKHFGYNAAFVSVYAEGSSLYPSESVSPSPRFDSGGYFSNGQDPRRKDVVEMLMRIFDREGLRLIPCVEFSGSIPELEEIRRTSPESSGGVNLVNSFGSVRTLVSSRDSIVFGGYNPIDERVQDTMNGIVSELVSRYASHRCFKGIGIQLSQNSFTHLPGEYWGYDDKTINRFAKVTNTKDLLESNESDLSRFRQRRAFLSAKIRPEWLRWRASELTKLYEKMTKSVKARGEDKSLYLLPTSLLESSEIKAEMRPSLHTPTDYESSLLRLGLSPNQLSKIDGLKLIAPYQVAPNIPLAKKRTSFVTSTSEEFQKILGRDGRMFYKVSQRNDMLNRNRSKGSSSFFSNTGNYKETLSLFETFNLSSGIAHKGLCTSLANNDLRNIVHGGILMPMGQNNRTKKNRIVFQQLPPKDFIDVGKTSNESSVVVRQASHNSRWFAYAVNTAPWSVKVTFDVAGLNANDQVISLADHRKVSRSNQSANQAANKTGKLEVRLEPFEIFGMTCASNNNVSITGFSASVNEKIQNQLLVSLKKLQSLVRALPEQSNSMLQNSGFEGELKAREFSGWMHSNNASAKVERETGGAKEGDFSLHIDGSSKVTWIRKRLTEIPETGRLSILVWMKTKDSKSQPAVRVCVDGKLGSKEYYRFGEFGSLAKRQSRLVSNSSDPSQLAEDWKPFAVHFDDLPAEGLSELMIGVDVYGSANMWIDQVQVFDRWFDENDRIAITQILARAAHQLQVEKDFAGCYHTLEGYWPKFLLEYSKKPSRTALLPPTPKPIQRSPKVIQRMRELIPRNILPFEIKIESPK